MRNIEKALRAPLQATWAMTGRCNLACPYCLEDALPVSAAEAVSAETRRRIVDEIAANRVLAVTLSGGEPLLVPEIMDIVHTLREAGTFVRLTTNGILVEDATAGGLADAGLNVAEVSVHPGAEDAAKVAARRLLMKGLRTTLRLVVTPENMARASAFARELAEVGVETVALQEVVQMGRAARDPERSTCDPGEVRRLSEAVAALHDKEGLPVGFTSTTLADLKAGHPVPCTLADPGRKSCEIRPDGEVIPCAPARAFGARNSLLEKGLSRAFRDMPAIFGPFTGEEAGGACEGCLSLADCGGGCRAMSLLIAGRRRAGNPLCRQRRV